MSGRATPSAFSTSSASDARFEALEERFTRLERLLEQAVRPPVPVETMDVEDSYSDCGSEDDEELVFEQVEQRPQASSTVGWGLPSLIPEAPDAHDLANLDNPSIKLQSPPIPEPDAAIAAKAVSCLLYTSPSPRD